MNVTEVLFGLGSWRLALRENTPARITDALGMFGHVAVVDGRVDLEAAGDGVLAGARYVGVLRDRAELELTGSGLVFWLGDEDDKGPIIESRMVLTSRTLAEAVTQVLGASNAVIVGTVHPQTNPAARYTNTFQFVPVRTALTAVCEAFGVEFRINPDGSVDVGTVTQLYGSTIDSIISRRGAGSDVDLRSLGAEFDTASSVKDWSGRVVLLGETKPVNVEDDPEPFITGSADVPINPYKNLRGNPVQITRLISESGETEGTVASRAQLQLNRFAREVKSLKVTAQEYETTGTDFRVGQQVFIYDPDAGVFDATREVLFQGQAIHPAITRITEATWQPAEGTTTIGFRNGDGVWTDLTPFVVWETGEDSLVVSDLPRSLLVSRDSIIGGRLDMVQAAAPDASIPSAPTNLVLETGSYLASSGDATAFITATWDAPTTNTDGSTLNDFSHYLVESRWISRVFGGAQVTTATTAEVVDLVGGLPHEVRVAAVDRGGKRSAWTTVGITTAVDSIAPQAPADPVLSTFLGKLRVDYAGVGTNGNPMPLDTKQVNVHVGTPGFTPDASNRVDALPPFGTGSSIISTTNGQQVAVRLVAEDHAGNFSQPSAEVTGTAAALGDGEIGSLGVGRLTAGTLDAVVVVGQRIVASPTGITTGRRAELWTGGLRAFDTSETLTLDLNGVSNMMMGRLITGPVSTRRIELGVDGSAGELRFYAPDNAYTFFKSITSGDGREGLQIGAAIPGAPALWNSMFYNQQEWASYQTKIHDFAFQDRWSVVQAPDRGTGVSDYRLLLQPGEFTVRGGTLGASDRAWTYNLLSGHVDHWFQDGGRFEVRRAAATGQSAGIHLTQTDGIGIILRSYTANELAGTLDVRNGFDNGFSAIRASAFQVNSDQRGKEDIKDATVSSPLELVDAIRPRQYRRKHSGDRPVLDEQGKVVSATKGRGPVETGVIAQELPAFVASGTEDTEMGYDTGRWLLLLTLAIQELNRKLAKA